MYKYGPQPFINELDPSCKAEDLGDDAVKAGKYGLKNLKVIMKNLSEWTKMMTSNIPECQKPIKK